MKILERYAEYAVTGGLFWAFAFLLLVLFGEQTLAEWQETLSGLEKNTSLRDALAAVGMIAIVATGLLIDAVGPSLFAVAEIVSFRTFLRRDASGFLERFVRAFMPDAEPGVAELFRDSPILRGRYGAWSGLRSRYAALFTQLTTVSLKLASGATLDELKDRLTTWRTGRALGSAVIVLSAMLFFFVIVPSSFHGMEQTPALVALLVLDLLVWAMATVLALGQYHKLLHTMVAIITVHARAEMQQPAPAGVVDIEVAARPVALQA